MEMRDFWHKYKKIIGAILIFLIFLFILDKNDFIVKCFHLNIEFWSAMLGFLGVILTILYASYQSRKDERRANRPFLVYSMVLAVYPYRVLTSNKDGLILDYIIDKTGEEGKSNDKCYTLVFPMMVKNIGKGVAFISKVYVEYEESQGVPKTFDSNNNRDKIIEVNQEKKFFVRLNGFTLNDLEKLTLRIDYEDMYHEEYNDGIVLSKRKNEENSVDIFNKFYIYRKEDFQDALESKIHKFIKPDQVDRSKDLEKYQKTLEECLDENIYFVRDIEYDKGTTRNQENI